MRAEQGLGELDSIEKLPRTHIDLGVPHGFWELGVAETRDVIHVLPEAVLGRDPAIDVVDIIENVSIAICLNRRQSVIQGL